MEATEIKEKIDEAHERARENFEHREHAAAKTKIQTAIYISVLAMLLAICNVSSSNATKDLLSSAIQASDTYAYYQAKAQRQVSLRLTAQQIETIAPALPEEGGARQAALAKAQELRAQADKLEVEDSGNGRQQLLARAQAFKHVRDHAAAKDPYFDFAEALLQIAIVLASVFVITDRRFVLWISYGLAVLGVLLLVNGFTLAVPLPLL